MILPRFSSLLAVTFFFSAIYTLNTGAVTVKEMYKILGEQGIPFDVDAVDESAAEGLLKAADPGARILTAEEAQQLSRGKTIEATEEWSGGICYLRLSGLYKGGGIRVVECLRKWVQAGRYGLIIDIRGAGGDSLASVDEIVYMFASENTVLYRIRDRHGRIVETHRTWNKTESFPAGMPLMLLTDGGTRGACEVMAAVLKGRDGVMIIGSRTRGERWLRNVVPLNGNEALYIAVRQVVIRDGADDGFAGAEPDVVVSEDDKKKLVSIPPEKRIGGRPLSDKAKQSRKLILRVAGDAVLCRAADVLLGLKALGQQPPLGFHGAETATNSKSPAGQ